MSASDDIAADLDGHTQRAHLLTTSFDRVTYLAERAAAHPVGGRWVVVIFDADDPRCASFVATDGAPLEARFEEVRRRGGRPLARGLVELDGLAHFVATFCVYAAADLWATPRHAVPVAVLAAGGVLVTRVPCPPAPS